MKELWEVRPENHKQGQVTHTMGWPLGVKAGGGSFMYHLEDNLVSIGFVVHLNYREPLPLPLHGIPALQASSADLAGARRRQAHGLWRPRHYRRRLPVRAETLFPRRRFDRLFRRLRECAAHQGLAQRHEDRHDGRRSSLRRLESGRAGDELSDYEEAYEKSWVYEDLKRVKNVKPMWSKLGLVGGLVLGAVDMWLNTLFGFGLGTWKHGKPD